MSRLLRGFPSLNMDLSDLNHPTPVADPAVDGNPIRVGDVSHWRDLVTQLGAEIAEPLTSALERVHELATTGRIERQSLRALRDELDEARQAAMIGQQLARFGSGRLRQAQERMHLTQTLSSILVHRSRELHARGLALQQDLKPVEVIADASLLFGLLNGVLDWALANACAGIAIQVDVKAWPAHARLTCAFIRNTEGRPGPSAAASHVDSLSWRLIEQIGWTMGLVVERSDETGKCSLTLTFPHTVGQHGRDVSAIELDEGFAPSSNSKPLAGSQVLVVASRRDVRNQVREAIQPMGLIVDFVHSVAEATEFCREGLPHAMIYEAALAQERFEELRSSILAEVPHVAFIEIVEEGHVFEMSGSGSSAPARVGRDAIGESLPSALMFELSKVL